MDGAQMERELVNILDGDGWAVMRSPASGGGTKRDQPDVLVGDGERRVYVAFESKSSNDDRIYIPEREVAQLIRFSVAFGAEPRIATRWSGDTTWYFAHPSELDYDPSRKEETRFAVSKVVAQNEWDERDSFV